MDQYRWQWVELWNYFFKAWFLDLQILAMEETMPYIWCWFKVCFAFWITLSQPFRQLPHTCVLSSKDYFIFISGQLLQDSGEHGKTVDLTITDPLSHLSSYEVSSLVRRNNVQKTIMVYKAFCKPMNGGFGRGIKCRNGKPINKIKIYATKEEVVQGRLPPGHWLDTIGNGNVCGAHCYFLLLAY